MEQNYVTVTLCILLLSAHVSVYNGSDVTRVKYII